MRIAMGVFVDSFMQATGPRLLVVAARIATPPLSRYSYTARTGGGVMIVTTKKKNKKKKLMMLE